MARGAPHGKHRSETVPTPTRPGRNGGTLRTGNPGNKGGGQKSKDFLTRCLQATEDEALWTASAKKTPLGLLDLSASYVHGKPKNTVEHQGEVTIKVEFDE